MACGAPVVSRDNTSIAEAIGDAALVIDPDDPESIAAALLKVVGNPELAGLRGWSRSGGEVLRERFLDRTIAVYERVLADS